MHAPRRLAADAARSPPGNRGRSCRIVARAATTTPLLLGSAAASEQRLERRPRRPLAWPVVCVVEVDRLGRCFDALVTGGFAYVGWIAVAPPGRCGSRGGWALGEAQAAVHWEVT